MSDIRKWLKIMESVPAIFPDQDPKHALIKQDATVMVSPSVGGGTARYMHSTDDGATVDIKGIAVELGKDEFSLPERDYEDGYRKGNDWFHASTNPDTIGTMNDKPEFRSGDMVKIADVYGSVIGPGMGVFIAYSTSGQEAIISFDNKEIVVPVANIAAVLEQNAKNNFEEMDNDGNLSPMSLGSKNVKVEEPAMDQRDEFSKWMSAVEEALQTEGTPELAEAESQNDCGCNKWNCATCFPEEVDEGCDVCDSGGEVEVDGLALVDEGDPVDDFTSSGGKIQQLPYMNRPRSNGREFGSRHIGSASGREKSKGALRGIGANVSTPASISQKPVVGEEESNFVDTPKSGKGVKIGQLVIRSDMKSKSSGQNSPMTYGDDNLDSEIEEEIPMDGEMDEGNWYAPDQDDVAMDSTMGDEEFAATQMGGDEEFGDENIDKILNIQSMGFSKDNKNYSREELVRFSPEQRQATYDRVMGDVTEAKPTVTKTSHHLDDLDDILNPRQADLPAEIPGNDDVEVPAASSPMNLPSASRADTQRRVGAITPSDQMRDFMNRIDPNAGAGEADIPDTPTDAMVVRTAADVPAVISSAMQASGQQNPTWHTVNNLPGYMQRNVRGMGRQLFGMFTSTPLENIQTLANVNGQGPNTDAEMRAVGSWLMQNAEDMGEVNISHGMAIPGYEPDVKEYRANGVRFHVVRDPMGQYIYAYPDQDARLGGPAQGQEQLPAGGPGNPPRLRESATLFEQMKWDEEIEEAFINESTLSKLIGKQKGGQRLVQWLHRKHKLSNDANLEPAPFSERLLWKEYKRNPDNFVIVSAANGVAGVKPYEKFIKDRTAAFAKKGKTYDPGGDSTLPYQIIAFTDDGQQVDPALFRQPAEPGEEPEERYSDPTVMKARMGKHSGKDMQNPNNTFNLLADEIGALRTVYVASGAVERDKMNKRADMKKTDTMDSSQAVQKIFARVRPVLKTLANQAILQINKRAQRYLEGGNFEGAQKVAASGQKLKQLLVQLDTSKDVSIDTTHNSSSRQLSVAIQQAISQAANAQPGTPEFDQYAIEAASGNASALRPILDGLRDKLVALQ